MSTQRLLIQVLPAALPEGYRRLIDPDVPLAEPERFLPAPLPGGKWAKLALAVAMAFAAAFINAFVLSLLGAVHNGTLRDWGNVGISMAVLAPLIWGIWRIVGSIREGRILADERDRGRYRLGMFLTPDALLVNSGERCDLVPRERLAVEQRKSSTAGARPVSSVFVFRDDDGREHTRSPWTEDTSRVSVEAWLETGAPHAQKA